LLTSANGKGGLYAGGFSRGVVTNGHYVIDLTGKGYKSRRDEIEVFDEPSLLAFPTVLAVEDEVQYPKGWLSFPIEDFGVPEYSIKVWAALAKDIVDLMNKNNKVVLTCQGGHGRTGVAAAIVCYILAPKGVGNNPVKWIRKLHCDMAVETVGQVDYVFKTLEPIGLPQDERLSTTASKTYGGYVGTTYTPAVTKELEPGKDKKKGKFKGNGKFGDDDYDIWYKEHYPSGRWEYD
jgi:protein-tyrosine phosphatase